MATHLVVFLTLLYGCLGSEARSDVAGRVSCDKASAQIHVATFASVAGLRFEWVTPIVTRRVMKINSSIGAPSGKVWALRSFFDEPVNRSAFFAEQEWCANVTLARPDLVALDYNHELLMNVLGIDGLLDGPWSEEFGQPPGSIGVEHEVSTPVIRNRLTGSRPMILHFPGRAKLSRYRPCPQEPGSHCQLSLPFEVMRLLMPEAYSGWRLKALQDYKHFERWATAKGIAVSRVVNSGATAVEKGRGVLRDVELGLRRAQQVLGPIDSRDMVVFAGDTLILDFHFYKGGSLMLYYGCREVDHPSERGMCEVDETSKVISFVEKPAANQRGFDFAFVSPLFYILEPKAWKKIPDYNSTLSRSISSSSGISFSFGRFVQHAIEDLKLPFWGMRMPGAFHLIGASTGLEEYRQLDRTFSSVSSQDGFGRRLRTKTYARVGLMGNPSDGFHGKTLSVTIRNFWASAEIWESQQLRLLPHPLFDPSSFSGLADLHFIGRREGYYGGTRLLMATCKRFQEFVHSGEP
eukprot:g8561.t1